MQLRRKQTKAVDERIRLLGEVINSIRAVKLYAWESHFGTKVSAIRSKEHSILRRIGLFRATVNSSLYVLPVFASIGMLS
jgi:ATP-binding cassette subfamily C (CFTR/MRP) protein 1